MWERVVLWAVLVVSVLTITVYPVLEFRNRMAGDAWTATLKARGEFAEAAIGMERARQTQSDDVLRMNVAWVCIAISATGLAITRKPLLSSGPSRARPGGG